MTLFERHEIEFGALGMCPAGLEIEVEENREALAKALDRIVALEEKTAGLEAELDARAVMCQLLGTALAGTGETLERIAKALCMPS